MKLVEIPKAGSIYLYFHWIGLPSARGCAIFIL